jgi:hypothetical protein
MGVKWRIIEIIQKGDQEFMAVLKRSNIKGVLQYFWTSVLGYMSRYNHLAEPQNHFLSTLFSCAGVSIQFSNFMRDLLCFPVGFRGIGPKVGKAVVSRLGHVLLH